MAIRPLRRRLQILKMYGKFQSELYGFLKTISVDIAEYLI